MIRLFAGLSVPAQHRTQLHLLCGGIPDARWTRPENFHITLTFIGNVDEETAADVDAALAGIDGDGFDVVIRGTGSFAQGDDPQVLWAGVVADPPEALARLKEKIDRALEQNRLPFENRKYTPHVTLARFRRPDVHKIGDFMQAHNLLSLPPFRASHFILYASHLGKNGPEYEELAAYPLSAV